MIRRFPTTSVSWLNWTISVMTSLLVFLFVQVATHDVKMSFSRFCENMVYMVILTFANLWLRQLLEKRKIGKVRFSIYSYGIAYLDFAVVVPLYSYITHSSWEGANDLSSSLALAFVATSTFNTLILVLQNLFILQQKQGRQEIENLQLKASVNEAANLLLRQQIHPHFLFNALSTIKSLYKENNNQGEEYLVHLADFLRASISNQQSVKSVIRDELAFCHSYVSMQQLRFGTSFTYTVEISAHTINNCYLPYFSLQPLIENALKHNTHTEQAPVNISVREADGYIIVRNNIQQNVYREHSTGNGLFNLSERYGLLGEGNIRINDEHGSFSVSLKILSK